MTMLVLQENIWLVMQWVKSTSGVARFSGNSIFSRVAAGTKMIT